MKIEFPKIIEFPTSKFTQKDNSEQTPEQRYGVLRPLLTWNAASRGDEKITESRVSRGFIMAGIVIGMIFLFMQEYLFIIMIASILLFKYALSKSTPEQATYEINTHGFKYDATQYFWHQLRHFYFKEAKGLTMLCIDTTLGIPSRIFANIGAQSQKKIEELLGEHILLLKEEPKDKLTEVYDKVMGKFNLD